MHSTTMGRSCHTEGGPSATIAAEALLCMRRSCVESRSARGDRAGMLNEPSVKRLYSCPVLRWRRATYLVKAAILSCIMGDSC